MDRTQPFYVDSGDNQPKGIQGNAERPLVVKKYHPDGGAPLRLLHKSSLVGLRLLLELF